MSIVHRLLAALTVPLVLGACASVAGTGDDAAVSTGPSSPVGPTVGEGDPGGVEAAVVVDEGYGLDVASQEFEHSYGQYLLFTDGSILDHLPPAAPGDFDVAADRAAEPASWGTWAMDGEQLIITWSGQEAAPYDAESWFRLVTAEPGEMLDAVYSVLDTVSQSGPSSSFFASGWQQLVLAGDGTFARTIGGSVDAGSDLGQVVTGSSEGARGRYRFDGPLLELTFDDGHTERAGAFFTGADRVTMLLNGVSFRRDS